MVWHKTNRLPVNVAQPRAGITSKDAVMKTTKTLKRMLVKKWQKSRYYLLNMRNAIALQRVSKVLSLSMMALLLSACVSSGGNYYLETSQPSKSVDQRIRFLVMHYTAEEFDSSLDTLTNEQVSAHYLIPEVRQLKMGKPVIWQLVPESLRAWHAGVSEWRGRTNINDTSIGIEIENKGFRQTSAGRQFYPYPDKQIDLVMALSKQIVQRYQIAPRNVVAHSDIAPQRKQDPGPLFPWQRLAQQGIGAWPDASQVKMFLAGRDKQQPVAMDTLLNKLARYGYPVKDALTPQQQRKVVAAFQMHFRQDDYRGLPDAQSEAIIDALLVKYPQ